MTVLVTGGAGFIGANFVIEWLRASDEPIVNLDLLTYAGNLRSLRDVAGDQRHVFAHGDIGDRELVDSLLKQHAPRAVIHLAAESHVDRSIAGAEAFIRTNVTGTHRLLEAATAYWQALDTERRDAFRFVNVSTDEVYGSLEADDPPFTEASGYAPNSPYSASKAAADHLGRAWFHTHGLPVLTTHCSNNYGPLQFPEKLIPLVIVNALAGESLPVYGDGSNVRDWLYVGDHCHALRLVLEHGVPGETYNAGGNSELSNLDVVRAVCRCLDERRPPANGRRYEELIRFVTDRPGHDRRYAIDASKLAAATGWAPAETFESGLHKTVDWYLDNGDWISEVSSGEYRQWVDLNYGRRTANE